MARNNGDKFASWRVSEDNRRARALERQAGSVALKSNEQILCPPHPQNMM
jgi:hypothetical protein